MKRLNNLIPLIADPDNLRLAFWKARKGKTPFNAVEKWYELEPEIFKEIPSEFKNKFLNLQSEKQVVKKQRPCET